jgi:hypothetical protein
MRAIVLGGFGGLESLVIEELPDPAPRAGHVFRGQGFRRKSCPNPYAQGRMGGGG